MADESFEDEIRELVASGNKIAAVKRYREETGAGLAEAKDAVESIAAGHSVPGSSPIEKIAPDDPELTDEIVSLLERGEPLLAIKLVRVRTGKRLKEAKEIVDQIAADRGLLSQSGSGCLGVVLLSLVMSLAIALLYLSNIAYAAEVENADVIGFEAPPPGQFTVIRFAGTTWTAPAGHAEISAKLSRTGRQCLHLLGGRHSEVEFKLSGPHVGIKYDQLTFAAERWTRREPFQFRVEAVTDNGEWQEIYNGDKAIKVGRGYLNQVAIQLPPDATRFRISCSSPPETGVLIDDMRFVEAKPMVLTRVVAAQRPTPLLIG